MPLGRCPLSIFCSLGTPPRVYHMNIRRETYLALPPDVRDKFPISGPYIHGARYSLGRIFMERIPRSRPRCPRQVPGRGRSRTILSAAPTPVQWFRGGLVIEAHRLLYHSTLGLRVIKKKEEDSECGSDPGCPHTCASQFRNNYFAEM